MVTCLLGLHYKMGITFVYMTRMWLGINALMQMTVLANEGVQNVTPWHKHYFEMKAFENQRCRKRLSL